MVHIVVALSKYQLTFHSQKHKKSAALINNDFDHLPKLQKAEAEITGILFSLLVRPHPRPVLPKERVSLNFKCDITYRILVGSGGGVSSNGATPKTCLHSSVQSSSEFAMMDHERQTHEARERVFASQNERIWGTTSLIRGGQGQFVLGGKAKRKCPNFARGRNDLCTKSPSLPSSSLLLSPMSFCKNLNIIITIVRVNRAPPIQLSLRRWFL